MSNSKNSKNIFNSILGAIQLESGNKMTQAAIAEKLGVSQVTVNKLLHDEHPRQIEWMLTLMNELSAEAKNTILEQFKQ